MHQFPKILLFAAALAEACAAAGQGRIPIDTVTFTADQFACDLRVGGRQSGHLIPGQWLSIKLPRQVEYLVECESHEIPVKLYARYNLTAPRNMPWGSALTRQVVLLPVAVLPNLIRASTKPGMEMTAISTVRSVGCKLSNDEGMGLREGTLTPPPVDRTIVSGTRVQPTLAAPVHCGDTNLVELQGSGWKAWFPNRSFQFSYRGRKISLFEPSQDASCCWIE